MRASERAISAHPSALRKSIDISLTAPVQEDFAPFKHKGRPTMGDQMWESALHAGRGLDVENAIRRAKCLNNPYTRSFLNCKQ